MAELVLQALTNLTVDGNTSPTKSDQPTTPSQFVKPHLELPDFPSKNVGVVY